MGGQGSIKMNKISIENLPEGKFINEPVYLDDRYILLSPDIEVTRELKQLLDKWEFKYVYSDGIPVDTPPLNSGIPGTGAATLLDKTLKEQEEEREVFEFFTKSVEFMDTYFHQFLEFNALSITPLSDKVKEITAQLREHRTAILSIPAQEEHTNDPDLYLAVHSLKTAILALAIGDFLKLPPHKLIELGISALLHELGMLRLPARIYRNNRILTDRERQMIRTHPVISFKTLKEAEYPSPIYRAVLEHHEYVDGTGYPRGIDGSKISLYGKIIAVASAYCAATSKREYRDKKDGHSGIMDLLKGKGKKYDETILRALVYILSVYPVGTYVLLTNGVKGIVIKTNLEAPKNPILKLITDENGVPYNHKPILQSNPDDEIQIERTLTKEEIKTLKALFE